MIFTFFTFPSSHTVESRVALARDGDAQAREDLIRDYTPFILKTASAGARRYLVQGRDEEVSIGMQAFNEAISAYSSDRPGFLAFAATVIRRRLIDYYRKEKRRDEVPFSALAEEEGADAEWPASLEAHKAFVTEDWSRVLERRDDIQRWTEVLGIYRLTLKDVVKSVPKHADARERAIHTAVLVSRNPELKAKFMKNRKLPIDDLLRLLPDEVSSRKTLERQRAYITAVAAVLTYDLSSLKDYLDLE